MTTNTPAPRAATPSPPRPTGTEPPASSRSVLLGGVEYVLPRRWSK